MGDNEQQRMEKRYKSSRKGPKGNSTMIVAPTGPASDKSGHCRAESEATDRATRVFGDQSGCCSHPGRRCTDQHHPTNTGHFILWRSFSQSFSLLVLCRTFFLLSFLLPVRCLGRRDSWVCLVVFLSTSRGGFFCLRF